jgi:hypothetical protein
MSIDYSTLKNELKTDPYNLGYSAYLLVSNGIVCDLLNSNKFTMPKTKYASARSILSGACLGAINGAAFLEKLVALAPSVPAIKWALIFLQTEAGVDVGDPAAQDMLTQLTGMGGITPTEVQAVKNLAMQPASRAELLFGVGTILEEADIREALNGNY